MMNRNIIKQYTGGTVMFPDNASPRLRMVREFTLDKNGDPVKIEHSLISRVLRYMPEARGLAHSSMKFKRLCVQFFYGEAEYRSTRRHHTKGRNKSSEMRWSSLQRKMVPVQGHRQGKLSRRPSTQMEVALESALAHAGVTLN